MVPGIGLEFLASRPQAKIWPSSSYSRHVGIFLKFSLAPGHDRICCTCPPAIRDDPYATPENVVPKSMETDIFPSSTAAGPLFIWCGDPAYPFTPITGGGLIGGGEDTSVDDLIEAAGWTGLGLIILGSIKGVNEPIVLPFVVWPLLPVNCCCMG